MKPKPIEWQGETLILLDQRALPLREEYLHCRHSREVREAISVLAVRGAPAIGVAAAYGMVLLFDELSGKSPVAHAEYAQAAEYLVAARPTAVNLQWAVAKMLDVYRDLPHRDVAEDRNLLVRAAQGIERDDQNLNERIGTYGASLFDTPQRVLTHCNAGALATAGIGTALGVVRKMQEAGHLAHVYMDETRPLLQGSRLTAYEMCREGIPCTLICDNMAATVMAQQRVDVVIVGADRIALNGDTANKIGTYGLAILAKYHQIPFYIAAPSTTFDFTLQQGSDIIIEERAPEEVRQIGTQAIAPPDVAVYNPAFDVTPGELVTGIITEEGVLYPPFYDNILEFKKKVNS